MKRLITLALVVFVLASTASFAKNRKSGGVSARAAAVMNPENGRLIFEKAAETRIAPASLTKIMTLLLICEAVERGELSEEDDIKISKRAARLGGSSMRLKSGKTAKLKDLIKGIAVGSGNDACVAVAEHIGGSERGFVKLMNARAKELGLEKTRFGNSHGLNVKGQLTTAKDMLALAAYYLKHCPQMLETHRLKTFRYGGRSLVNSNRLLGWYAGADGLKTGYVGASGYNMIATAKRNNTRILAVLLGASTPGNRARDAVTLLEKGFFATDPLLAYPTWKRPAPPPGAGPGKLNEEAILMGMDQPVSLKTLAKKHGAPRWLGKLRSKLKKGDELWRFCAPGTSGGGCRTGYCIIRNGEIFYAIYAR